LTLKKVKEIAEGLFISPNILLVEAQRGFVGSITITQKTDLPTLLMFSNLCVEQGYELVVCELHPHSNNKIQIRILGRKL